jgi:hypothetical protein
MLLQLQSVKLVVVTGVEAAGGIEFTDIIAGTTSIYNEDENTK